MKTADEEALMAAARFVVGLGRARAKLEADPENDGVELVITGWTNEGGAGYCEVSGREGPDDGPGGLLEDPRKALGEHYHRLAVLVADLEGEG